MMIEPKPIFTLMIEPVKHCNLKCLYCYSDTSSYSDPMDLNLFHAALEKVHSYIEQIKCREIHILWHGGEPLLAGLAFFKKSLAITSFLFSRIKCRQFIQTNGLLLDDDFCIFLRDNKFEVGISLDGPKEIHDTMRRFKNNQGTWERVMEKIKLMEKYRLAFGFCMTVTSLCRGKESLIYAFFRSLGHPFRVNPIIPSWNQHNNFLLKKGEYATFLCRLFDEWIQTGTRRIPVSPLDNYLNAVLGNEIIECQHQPHCTGLHIGIKPNGNAVLCSPFEDHILGNILENTLFDLYGSSLCGLVKKRRDSLLECRSCKNKDICHGGCPHNAAAFDHTIAGKDPFCKDYQMIFAHLRHAIKTYRPDMEILPR